MKMTRAVGLWLGWSLLTVGCGGSGSEGGEGRSSIVEQQRATEDFTGVAVGFGLRADVTVGGPASVSLRGEEEWLQHVQLLVRDGVLIARLEPGITLRPTEPVVLTVVAPSLSRLAASGGARVEAVGVMGADFTLAVSGGSVARVSGEGVRVRLDASGGSEVDLRGLAAQSLDVALSGGSQAHAHASVGVTAALSGGSRLFCGGQPPSRSVTVSGGAEVFYP